MKPKVFWLHFNRLRQKRTDPDVWVVLTKGKRYNVRRVEVSVPLSTVYRGDTAPQPKAFLRGEGCVSVKGKVARIHPC